jgi:DNA-binding SARP family transcriptional activator
MTRRVEQEWQPVSEEGWMHTRVRGVLACLLTAGGRRLGREQVMEAIWPEAETRKSSSRLDRVVYDIRMILEPRRDKALDFPSPLLATDNEVLVLAEQERLWVDADAFEEQVQRAAVTEDRGERERWLQQATDLYTGDYLPEEWSLEAVVGRRETLRRRWIGALLELADLRIARGAHDAAISVLDRMVVADPTNEAAAQRLIRLLAQSGRRPEALGVYQRLTEALQSRYRLAPLHSTRAIYDIVNKEAQRGPLDAMRGNGSSPVGGIDTPPRPRHEYRSPLVGRTEELTRLRTLLQEIWQLKALSVPGQSRRGGPEPPHSLLLTGEIGIGKTRLAEEIGQEAKRMGWTVIWSRSYALERSIPYRLWIEVLRAAMMEGVWSRSQLQRRPLIFAPLVSLLPELEDVARSVFAPSLLSSELEQLHLWEAALQLLITISQESPLLIVIDDLQWIDTASAELLVYVMRRLQGYSLIILGTYRENELALSHPLRAHLTDLYREKVAETLPLSPLSSQQIAVLLAHLPERAVSSIAEQVAGNPFFAEELAFSVLSLGADPAAGFGRVPETISAALDLRLSSVSTECQQLLEKAAVLGGSFTFAVMCGMQERTEDEVIEVIEEAVWSGMLIEEGKGALTIYTGRFIS